jgi:hypothetical protein
MAIMFDEISAEVAPERGGERAESVPQTAPADGFDPAELLRREVQVMREREQRLIAD